MKEEEEKKSEEKKQSVAEYLEEHKKEFTQRLLESCCDFLQSPLDNCFALDDLLKDTLDFQTVVAYTKKLKKENKDFCALCDRQDEEAVLPAFDPRNTLAILYALCNSTTYKATTFSWFKAVLERYHAQKGKGIHSHSFNQEKLDQALFRACDKPCKLPFIKFVVEKGANVNARIRGTPIMHKVLERIRLHCKSCAENISKFPVLKFLFEQGGNPNLRDLNGQTLTEVAEKFGIKLTLKE
jgi:hypothetical protein